MSHLLSHACIIRCLISNFSAILITTRLGMKAVLNLERRLRVHTVPNTVGTSRTTLTTGSSASFPYILPVISPYLQCKTYNLDFSRRHKVPTLLFTDSLRRVEAKQGTSRLTCFQIIYIFTCKVPWDGAPTSKLDS